MARWSFLGAGPSRRSPGAAGDSFAALKALPNAELAAGRRPTSLHGRRRRLCGLRRRAAAREAPRDEPRPDRAAGRVVRDLRHGHRVRPRQASFALRHARRGGRRRGEKSLREVKRAGSPRHRHARGRGAVAGPGGPLRSKKLFLFRLFFPRWRRRRSTSGRATSSRSSSRGAGPRRSTGDPFAVYRALRAINPSPYHFYLGALGAIVGSSPERLVRSARARRRGRGGDGADRGDAPARRLERDEEDLALARTPRRSEGARRARHARRPRAQRRRAGLGARDACTVKDFFAVERYSHVMHLVSHVVGSARAGLDAFDALRACFPAGTVSGAPKMRAMEIIEDARADAARRLRGRDGLLRLPRATSTLHRDPHRRWSTAGRLHVQAGAGIVADSDPEAECAGDAANKARRARCAVASTARRASHDDPR